MPPRTKVTKDGILQAAVDLVRQHGEQGLNARTVAATVHCSTQPVFSNFATMEELRFAVVGKANELFGKYIENEVKQGEYPVYKASGMAYIRFAKEERELFKLLYMRDRTGEVIPETDEHWDDMEAFVTRNTGLPEGRAKLFHLEMWAFVHGIASLVATRFLPLDFDLISQMLTDAYQGLRKRYEEES